MLGRESKQKLYGSYRWKKIRARAIERHPLCQACLKNGILKITTTIDHIKPFENLQEFYCGLLQGLCKPCHSKKTLAENSWDFDTAKKEKTKAYYL